MFKFVCMYVCVCMRVCTTMAVYEYITRSPASLTLPCASSRQLVTATTGSVTVSVAVAAVVARPVHVPLVYARVVLGRTVAPAMFAGVLSGTITQRVITRSPAPKGTLTLSTHVPKASVAVSTMPSAFVSARVGSAVQLILAPTSRTHSTNATLPVTGTVMVKPSCAVNLCSVAVDVISMGSPTDTCVAVVCAWAWSVGTSVIVGMMIGTAGARPVMTSGRPLIHTMPGIDRDAIRTALVRFVVAGMMLLRMLTVTNVINCCASVILGTVQTR